MAILIRPAFSLFALLTLLTGLIYPLAVTGVAQWIFPAQAHGSLITQKGQVIGSALIGQNFTNPAYFWGRPSATTPTPYDASNSSGSNQGPLNPDWMKAVEARIAALHQSDPDNHLPIPVDLVTASASGLDPDISPAAAQYQAARIARVRGISLDTVHALIKRHTEGRWLGLLGENRVNVLQLNLNLDQQ
jgi:K+-transporting ATPase ATPase C chain